MVSQTQLLLGALSAKFTFANQVRIRKTFVKQFKNSNSEIHSLFLFPLPEGTWTMESFFVERPSGSYQNKSYWAMKKSIRFSDPLPPIELKLNRTVFLGKLKLRYLHSLEGELVTGQLDVDHQKLMPSRAIFEPFAKQLDLENLWVVNPLKEFGQPVVVKL